MWNENIPETMKKFINENKSGINKVAAFGGLPLKREFDGEDFCIVGIPYDTTDTPKERFYTHGSPFRRAFEDGFLDAAHSIQIGIRGYNDSHRLEFAKENGIEVITARMLHKMGMQQYKCRRNLQERRRYSLSYTYGYGKHMAYRNADHCYHRHDLKIKCRICLLCISVR